MSNFIEKRKLLEMDIATSQVKLAEYRLMDAMESALPYIEKGVIIPAVIRKEILAASADLDEKKAAERAFLDEFEGAHK